MQLFKVTVFCSDCEPLTIDIYCDSQGHAMDIISESYSNIYAIIVHDVASYLG
jgi:hypothetical protein